MKLFPLTSSHSFTEEACGRVPRANAPLSRVLNSCPRLTSSHWGGMFASPTPAQGYVTQGLLLRSLA